MTPEELAAITAKWKGFDAGLSVGVDAENEVVIATQDNEDFVIATVHCDYAEQFAALWASAGPDIAALVAEVLRLKGIVQRARKDTANWEHSDECGADLHADCGQRDHYRDGTVGGPWICYQERPREECERVLRERCSCGMYALRAALEVSRG